MLLAALCPAAPAGADAGVAAGHYRVVSEESELRVLIFSAGALGALGHDHVITSHALEGSVRVGASPADSAIELSLPVESLVVDDPEARAASGFESEVDEEDRRGTRANMLGAKVLAAERYPEVGIASEAISGEFSRMTVHARIEINGTAHDVDLLVSAAFHGDRLFATGRTKISHSELGLEPFSAGFGTLRVAEEMVFRYRIVAARIVGEMGSYRSVQRP